MFSILKFIESNTVDASPSSWVNKDKTSAKYTKHSLTLKELKLYKDKKPPKGLSVYAVKVLGVAGK
jgi:hypothetical protein